MPTLPTKLETKRRIMKIIELDRYVNIAPLEDLHLKNCLGIAKSKLTPSTRLIPGYEMGDDFHKAVDYKNNELPRIASVADDAIERLTPEEYSHYKDLSYVEKRKFLELYLHGYTDGDFVRVRFTKNEFLKDNLATFYADKTEESINYPHFLELMDWVKTLPFQEIGRVMFFVTRQFMASDMHYDRRDDWYDGRHHFMWFNPCQAKEFFLVDGYEKEYVDAKVAFFNTSYLHGNEAIPYTAYTLRVDGQLTEEFCKRTGILWKKR